MTLLFSLVDQIVMIALVLVSVYLNPCKKQQPTVEEVSDDEEPLLHNMLID